MATSSTYNNWTSADTAVGLKVTNGAPLDRRFVVDTFDNYSRVIPKACRYPGLRFYVLDEEKEYWFKSGVEKADLVEYHPEAMFVESDLEDVDTTKLAVGSEVTIFDSEGNPTKYVWNGTNWKNLVPPTGSDGIPPLTTNTTVDTYEELSAVLDDHLSANGITPTIGCEASVIFVDTTNQTNPNLSFYNKYVLLTDNTGNTHWYMENGTQVYDIQIPAGLFREGVTSIVPKSTSTGANKYISYYKNTDGSVDIVIDHNFSIQYIDISTFQRPGGDSDKDHDKVTDSDYGTEVFIPHHCIKSNGRYRVVLTVAVAESLTDTLVVVLQR